MKKEELLQRIQEEEQKLETLNAQKAEILTKFASIHLLEPVVEERINQGLHPTVDLITGQPLTKENIRKRIEGLAEELIADQSMQYPVLVSVLNGALPFAQALHACLIDKKYQFQSDALQAGSYVGVNSGTLKINEMLKVIVVGRNVLLIDDVDDTGKTAEGIINFLKKLGAASVKLMVLVDKKQERVKGVGAHPDYAGFTVSKDAFIIGWGMDYDGLCRNFDDFIGGVSVDTLPQGQEKELLESKNQLNKDYQICVAAISHVESELLQLRAQLHQMLSAADAVSPGHSRDALFGDSRPPLSGRVQPDTAPDRVLVSQ